MFFNWYKTAQIKSKMVRSFNQGSPDKIFLSNKASKDLEEMDAARREVVIKSIRNWPSNAGNFEVTKNLQKIEVPYTNRPRVIYFQCKESEDTVMYVVRCFPTHAEYNKFLPSLASFPDYCIDNNGEKNSKLLSIFGSKPWYEKEKNAKQKISVQFKPAFNFALICYQKFKNDGLTGLEEILEEVKRLDEDKIQDLIDDINKINTSDKSFENFIKNILIKNIFKIWDIKISDL